MQESRLPEQVGARAAEEKVSRKTGMGGQADALCGQLLYRFAQAVQAALLSGHGAQESVECSCSAPDSDRRVSESHEQVQAQRVSFALQVVKRCMLGGNAILCSARCCSLDAPAQTR